MVGDSRKTLCKTLKPYRRRPGLCLLCLITLVIFLTLFTKEIFDDDIEYKSKVTTLRRLQPYNRLDPLPTVPYITIPKDPPLNRRPPILLLTYMRSGSSFTADVIQQSPDVFYLYEPLKAFTNQFYYTQSKLCSITDKGCRVPKTKSEDATYVVRNILNLFLCDFHHTDRHIVRGMALRNLSKTQNQFADCLRRKKNGTKIVELCTKKMEDMCVSKNVFIKTIRLSMEVVGLLLDLIPGLKVIHLIRDPRGIMYSRFRGRLVDESNFEASAKTMCNRILMDVMRSYHLKLKYPGRIRTQLYEYLAEHPLETMYDLHKFTNTTIRPFMKEYVYNHTLTGNINRGYFNTIRGNSTRTSLAWRMQMKWEYVQTVDRQCRDLYDHIGFIPFSDKSQLSNLSFKTRKKQSPLFEKF
uniref:Carbohydrate sulfotransferase 1-like n=1 Tax=Crassostrea virginica TaxID=6565 RepID=A0A8B8ALF6_CRAVI|nr:carbohydrate sulfotransferase 1-like [Crassostrea virginica]